MEIQIYKSLALGHTKKKFSLDSQKAYMRKMKELEIVEAIRKQYQKKSVI